MEHLKDWRLTRTKVVDWKTQHEYELRVGDLCADMLNQLAGERFLVPMTAAEEKPPKEQKWWVEAQKLGEEKWLMQYVIPEGADEGDQTPNDVILRTIRAKYPQRLKDVYQTVLLKRRKIRSDAIAKAIVLSKLPREEKIALLEEGIERGHFRHRQTALETLADLDTTAFRKNLLRMLEGIPANLEVRVGGNYWEPRCVELIRQTNDPKCWDALASACRRVPQETRLYFIRIAGWLPYPSEPYPGRREALRFLLRYLDQEAVKDFAQDDAREIRDRATFQLAKYFEIIDWKINLESEKPLQSPRELSLLRERVRELTERELAKPIK